MISRAKINQSNDMELSYHCFDWLILACDIIGLKLDMTTVMQTVLLNVCTWPVTCIMCARDQSRDTGVAKDMAEHSTENWSCSQSFIERKPLEKFRTPSQRKWLTTITYFCFYIQFAVSGCINSCQEFQASRWWSPPKSDQELRCKTRGHLCMCFNSYCM